MRLIAGWLYALGLVAAVSGVIIYFANSPEAPDRDELSWFSGHVVGILLEKDLDGTDIVYLRYRDHETLYKYISLLPQYVAVRDRLGIYRDIDILIETEAEPDRNGAMLIWGLVEYDPYNEGTVITYDEVYETVTRTNRSWQAIAIYVLLAGIGAIVLGFVLRRVFPYVPRDPSV